MNEIGVNTWVWVSPPTDAALDRLVPFVASLGFDAIELPVENPGDWSPSHARELIDEHGLAATACLVMPPGRELGAADADTVAGTQDYLRQALDAAAAIGSRVLCGPAYTSVGRTWRLAPDERERLLDDVAAALAPVAEYAGERGVRIAVEPLNRFETSLINTVAQGLELVERVGSSSVGLAYDTFHANIEEKSIGAALRHAGPHLKHLHVCENDRGIPGSGHVAWAEFFSTVADLGYDRWMTIESFGFSLGALSTAAAVWRDLASTPEAIAFEGVKFLRAHAAG